MDNKTTTSAFIAGAAVGTAAGLMSKKKNRQRVTRVVKQTRSKFEILAKEGIDFTRDKIAELREDLNKRA